MVGALLYKEARLKSLNREDLFHKERRWCEFGRETLEVLLRKDVRAIFGVKGGEARKET
jgi:hypothetical protein